MHPILISLPYYAYVPSSLLMRGGDEIKPKNRLNQMENKAKMIKKIQFISNTILANACYHVKEMENQFSIAEKVGNLSDDEREVISQAWDYRTKIAKELMIELKDYMRDKNVKKKT